MYKDGRFDFFLGGGTLLYNSIWDFFNLANT